MKLFMMTCGILAMTADLQAADHSKPLLQQPPLKELGRTNPYGKQSVAERAGQKLFKRECANCHGKQAQGTERAPALASPVLSQTTPGAIFWVLRNGSLRRGMPSFSHLPEPQRWQIVTYLKTLQ